MKRVSLLLVLVFAGHAGAAPEIFVRRPEVDLGVLDNNARAEHTFVIENRGDEPLLIKGISRCDGPCKSYVLQRDKIRAGKSATLKFSFDLYAENGVVSRERVIRSNDPAKAEYSVRLSCRVTPNYLVEPRLVLFDATSGGEKLSRAVSISANKKMRKPLTKVSSDSDSFSGSLRRGRDGSYVLRVEVVGALKGGITRGELKLSSTSEEDVPCIVRVAAYVRPSFSILPEKLLFDPVAEIQRRIVFVRQRGDRPVAVLDAVAPSDHFHCRINHGVREGDYAIYVNAWELSSAKGELGPLILKTSRGKGSIVAIPIEIKPPVIVGK